jgi:hypothetical protein
VWTGNSGANVKPASNSDFVTAVLNNDGQNNFELQGGNSQSGGLTTFYDGSLPGGCHPMDQEGAIVLGTGGADVPRPLAADRTRVGRSVHIKQ